MSPGPNSVLADLRAPRNVRCAGAQGPCPCSQRCSLRPTGSLCALVPWSPCHTTLGAGGLAVDGSTDRRLAGHEQRVPGTRGGGRAGQGVHQPLRQPLDSQCGLALSRLSKRGRSRQHASMHGRRSNRK